MSNFNKDPNQFNDILKNRKFLQNISEPEPGIYLLFYKDKVVYVGKSLNPEQRIASHISSSDKRFDSYHIIHCNEEQLKDLESKYILNYIPKYNKMIPYSKSYPYLGKTTPIKNNQFSISCVVINNKLYIDLSEVGFELIRKERDNNDKS